MDIEFRRTSSGTPLVFWNEDAVAPSDNVLIFFGVVAIFATIGALLFLLNRFSVPADPIIAISILGACIVGPVIAVGLIFHLFTGWSNLYTRGPDGKAQSDWITQPFYAACTLEDYGINLKVRRWRTTPFIEWKIKLGWKVDFPNFDVTPDLCVDVRTIRGFIVDSSQILMADPGTRPIEKLVLADFGEGVTRVVCRHYGSQHEVADLRALLQKLFITERGTGEAIAKPAAIDHDPI